MAKQSRSNGRPGVSYEKFVEVWEQLLEKGLAGTNAARDFLGGSYSTIITFRERYEREKASKELAIIKNIELTDAVHQAIGSVKVKEIEILEKVNTQLKARIDDILSVLKESEEKLVAATIDLDDAKFSFDSEKLSLERKLAAAHARIDDLVQREQRLLVRYEELDERYNQTERDAAVARKEVEMLREQKE